MSKFMTQSLSKLPLERSPNPLNLTGMLCMITGGHNLGRVGIIVHRDRHPGSFDIVHVKDSMGHTFATGLSNVFVIGQTASNPLVSIPRGKGLKLTIAEERDRRLAAK